MEYLKHLEDLIAEIEILLTKQFSKLLERLKGATVKLLIATTTNFGCLVLMAGAVFSTNLKLGAAEARFNLAEARAEALQRTARGWVEPAFTCKKR